MTDISTHAPRVGSDPLIQFLPRIGADFNSRSPCGERRIVYHLYSSHFWISTHAPRVGSDTAVLMSSVSMINFNSRSPCGERQIVCQSCSACKLFQLTLPVWGATFTQKRPAPMQQFQLTLPVWGATYARTDGCLNDNISTHAPRVGSDSKSIQNFVDIINLSAEKHNTSAHGNLKEHSCTFL